MINLDEHKLEKFENLMGEFEAYTNKFFPEFLNSSPKDFEKIIRLKEELEKNNTIVQYKIIDDSSAECIDQINNLKTKRMNYQVLVTVLKNSFNILNFNNKVVLTNMKSLEHMYELSNVRRVYTELTPP